MGQFNKDDLKKLAGITTVIGIIIAAFKLKFKPPTPLPPPLIYVGGKMRQGLSSQQVASRIISRQQEAGAPVGVLPDGSDNVSERMEKIRIEETVNALLTEARLDIVIPPGIPITAVGGNAGGPVAVQGATTNFASGSGVIS